VLRLISSITFPFIRIRKTVSVMPFRSVVAVMLLPTCHIGLSVPNGCVELSIGLGGLAASILRFRADWAPGLVATGTRFYLNGWTETADLRTLRTLFFT